MARIYLSSTFHDLKAQREVVYRALRLLRHDVIAMEDYVATDARPLEKCLADVAACDLYVCVVAWEYGFVPLHDNPDLLSVTELEYRKARELAIPCLIFLVAEQTPWPPAFMDQITGAQGSGERLQAFRQRLLKDHMVAFFHKADELAHRATVSVVRALEDLRRPTPRQLAVFLCHASEDKQNGIRRGRGAPGDPLRSKSQLRVRCHTTHQRDV